MTQTHAYQPVTAEEAQSDLDADPRHNPEDFRPRLCKTVIDLQEENARLKKWRDDLIAYAKTLKD